VTRDALREAVEVKAAFDLITRYADTLGAKPHSEQGLTREQAIAHEGRFFERGYAWGSGSSSRFAASLRS
jgi:hypothetical protein